MHDFDRSEERLRATFKQLSKLPVDESPPDPEFCHEVVRPELSRHVQIWTPRNKDVTRLLATEAYITHLLLHRVDGRSEACVALTRFCYGCKIKVDARWMGYLGALITKTRVPVVLSITPYAMKNLVYSMGDETNLYRRWLQTSRGGDTPRARQWLAAQERSETAVMAYEARAQPVLCRRYNLPALELHELHKGAARYFIDNAARLGHDEDTR